MNGAAELLARRYHTVLVPRELFDLIEVTRFPSDRFCDADLGDLGFQSWAFSGVTFVLDIGDSA